MRRPEGVDEEAADTSAEGGQSAGRSVGLLVGLLIGTLVGRKGRALVDWSVERSRSVRVVFTVVSDGFAAFAAAAVFCFCFC